MAKAKAAGKVKKSSTVPNSVKSQLCKIASNINAARNKNINKMGQ